METIKLPINYLQRDLLKDYATTGKHMFLYVTSKIYKEYYKKSYLLYFFGKEMYKLEIIDHIEYDDYSIEFLKPEFIYYKDDYMQERKNDWIYFIKCKVENEKLDKEEK